MTLPTGRKTQDLDQKETHELNPGGQDSPDSDFSDREGVPTGKGKNTGDQKLVGNPAAAKPVAERLTAEKLDTESHEKLVEKLEAVKLAGGKPTAEEQAAEQPKANLLPDDKEIGNRLRDLIEKDRKGLQKIYSEKGAELDKILRDPIKKGVEMASKLITEKECSFEIAKDLTALTLYDVAILIDDSDSMVHEEGGARKSALIQYIDHITEIYSMANESGVLAMRFMNGYRGKKNWTGESSKGYLDGHSYGGLTRIGTALKEKILDKFANSKQSKPLLVLIVTDGAVEGEKKGRLESVIRDCVNEREEAGKGFDAVTFQFSRIGNDSGAAKLLEDLDQDQEIGEYIDVLPIEFDPEKGEFDKWFVLPKILLGAIIPDWNKQDDHGGVEVKNHLAGKGSEDNDESDWEE